MNTVTIANDAEIESQFEHLAQPVIAQLRCESEYLDNVIAACGKLKNHLLRPTQKHTSKADSSSETIDVTRAQALQRMEEMHIELNEKFHSLQIGRQNMRNALQTLNALTGVQPTVTRLAALLTGPSRDQLKRQRHDLKKKLFEFQAVMLSNQVILAYDLDFNHRFMAGLTGVTPAVPGYNASGQMNQRPTSSVMFKDC